MNQKIEILAPAGSMEDLRAAVYNGANAVYLGTQQFNARRNAANFDAETLKQAVGFCHLRGVQVYHTLNTLLFDVEIATIAQEITQSYLAGVDAYIVSDFAMISLIKQLAPNARLHASTQMSVHTPAALASLKKLGFSRVVLARELSKSEMNEIIKEANAIGIEVEVFIHGALCMSVSGQCYYSGVLGERSGNRGLCAQPCRLPYEKEGKLSHPLSLKDLSLMAELPQLSKMGVHSVKIEGRMKRPEYVAAAVSSAVHALSGTYTKQEADQLENAFSRSGFTDGYFQHKHNNDMFGIRQKEDVLSMQNVLDDLHKQANKEQNKINLSMKFEAKLSQPMALTLSAKNETVTVQSQSFSETAEKHSVTKEDIEKQLRKIGDTPFTIEKIDVALEDKLFIPTSAVNLLRREGIAKLEKALTKRNLRTSQDFTFKAGKVYRSQKMAIDLRLSSINQIPSDLSSVRHVYLPIKALKEVIIENKDISKFAVELPRIMFGKTQDIKKELIFLKEKGINTALCNTFDAFCLAQSIDIDVIAGFSMNIANTLAVAQIEALGAREAVLSTEGKFSAMRQIGTTLPRGLITYGYLPLMLMRLCPLDGNPEKGCRQCPKYLTDRKGIQFPVVCTQEGYTEMLNSRPIYLADMTEHLQYIDFQLFYFTIESKREVEKVIKQYQNKEKTPKIFTRGLYTRGVK